MNQNYCYSLVISTTYTAYNDTFGSYIEQFDSDLLDSVLLEFKFFVKKLNRRCSNLHIKVLKVYDTEQEETVKEFKKIKNEIKVNC